MANSPIPDQSSDFLKSGMTLITDPRSDKYLGIVKKSLEKTDKCQPTDSEQKNM